MQITIDNEHLRHIDDFVTGLKIIDKEYNNRTEEQKAEIFKLAWYYYETNELSIEICIRDAANHLHYYKE